MSSPTVAKKARVKRRLLDDEALANRQNLAQQAANVTSVITKLRWLRLLGIVVGLASIAAAIAAAEEVWSVRTYTSVTNGRSDHADQLKLASSILTIFHLGLIIARSFLHWRLIKLQNLTVPGETYWQTWLPVIAGADIALSAVHCPMYTYGTFSAYTPAYGSATPGTITYDYDAILSVFMFYRLYMIVTLVLKEGSGFESSLARVVARSAHVKFDAGFAFRSLLDKRPVVSSLFVYIFSVFVLTYAMRVAEHPAGGSLGGASAATNCFWCIIITSLTVGYGDMFPLTNFGRFVSTVAAVVGICIIALLVNAVSAATKFVPDEARGLSELDMRHLLITRKRLASQVVAASLLYRRARVRAGAAGAPRSKEITVAVTGATSEEVASATANTLASVHTSVAVRPDAGGAGATDPMRRKVLGKASAAACQKLVRAISRWTVHNEDYSEALRCDDTSAEVKRDTDEMKDAIRALHAKVDLLAAAAGVDVRRRGRSNRSKAAAL